MYVGEIFITAMGTFVSHSPDFRPGVSGDRRQGWMSVFGDGSQMSPVAVASSFAYTRAREYPWYHFYSPFPSPFVFGVFVSTGCGL